MLRPEPRGGHEAAGISRCSGGGAAATWPLVARAQQRQRAAHRHAHARSRGRSGISSPRRGIPAGACSNRAGPSAATCRSIPAGPEPAPTDIRRHAAELVALAPDVIVAHGAATVRPLLQATRTVPIVFPIVGDPVGAGFVDSLARPGGNVTGFMDFEYSMGGKWLELLKQIAPGVTRVAVLRDPATPTGTGQFGVIQAVAPSLGMEVNPGQCARRRRDRARRRGIRAHRRMAV